MSGALGGPVLKRSLFGEEVRPLPRRWLEGEDLCSMVSNLSFCEPFNAAEAML